MYRWLLLLSLGSFLVAPTAAADVLPIVVDRTSETSRFWWADETAASAGVVDDALFQLGEDAGTPWISPRAARPSGGVSRVFRTEAITENNARQLGALFGASHIVFGEVRRDGPRDVPWLGVARVELVAELALVDVGTGATLARWTVRRTGHGLEADAMRAAGQAIARELAPRCEAALAGTRGEWASPEIDVVIVHSPEGAAPFIAFRAALREAHPGIVDVTETWASEGMVALRLLLDEGVTFSDAAVAVQRLDGATLDNALVREVRREEAGIWVDMRVLSPSDAAAP